jgi:oligoribonuclease (3'-5' exoribonuclease)
MYQKEIIYNKMENITKPSQFLFIDNEMGGLEKDKHSLLTVCLIATDNNFSIIDELYLMIKPDDGIYRVCATAMEVNKIDLVEHDRLAILSKQAGTLLYDWLRELTVDGKEKLTVVGHGVYGDVEWITYHLINRGSWEKFTSYRKMDTQAICQFLKTCGMFPEIVSGSLLSLGKHFGIITDEDDEKAHNAKFDTLLTLKVFVALRKILMPVMKSAPNLAET